MSSNCLEHLTENKNLDSVVTAVISKFVKRAEMGKKKYGTDDLKVLDFYYVL